MRATSFELNILYKYRDFHKELFWQNLFLSLALPSPTFCRLESMNFESFPTREITVAWIKLTTKPTFQEHQRGYSEKIFLFFNCGVVLWTTVRFFLYIYLLFLFFGNPCLLYPFKTDGITLAWFNNFILFQEGGGAKTPPPSIFCSHFL